MRQKFLFVWHVLVFNAIKPLPYSLGYFNQHFQLSTQNHSEYDSYYMRIVRFGKQQSGWKGALLANIALMLFCLPLCFSADLAIHVVRLLWLKAVINVILALMMLGKFDMLRFRDGRNYLKLFYLFSCLVSSSYWTLTCVFLAAFENIVF